MQGSGAVGEVGLAHFRDVIWVLSSTAATTLQPSGPSQLPARLCTVVDGHAGQRSHRLLTQRQAEAQSPCKVQGACGQPEARQLRVGQHLGQLEDARHVLAVHTRQIAVVEAASAVREHLSASKAVNANAST